MENNPWTDSLINPFRDNTINVIKMMAQIEPQSGAPQIKDRYRTSGVVTGFISMAGETMTGNMMISFDEKSILEIVSKMLMEEFDQINSDIVDAVGELTNMICGGTKQALGELGYKVDMASPITITGKDVELTQLNRSAILSLPFSTDKGSFVIEADLSIR